MVKNENVFFLFAVYRRERQVLVHAGNVLVRGLLHDPALLRQHLPRPDLDR